MKKLDNKRKIALVTIGVAFVFFGFIGQIKPTQTAAVTAVQPTVAPVLVATESVSTTQVASAPAVDAAPVAEAVEKTADDATSIADFVQSVKQPAADNQEPLAVVKEAASDTTTFKKFIVYQDDFRFNHYALSGFMPDGQCIHINSFWKENCQEGQRCLQIKYDATCSKEGQGWAGAYWLSPANNWGEQKGGFNLTGAKKLIFWARGENGGEVINSFKVGGITGAEHKYPDSDEASIGPITLTQDWQEYSIDLKDKNLSYIVGGFAWSANVQENPQGAVFYIDNICYE